MQSMKDSLTEMVIFADTPSGCIIRISAWQSNVDYTEGYPSQTSVAEAVTAASKQKHDNSELSPVSCRSCAMSVAASFADEENREKIFCSNICQ